jgi:hypothetical protein
MTVVRFTTSIDCCKKFMSGINGLPLSYINPMVGDMVRVYHSSDFEIEMKVFSRKWITINGSQPVLYVSLVLTDFWNIPEFENMLRSQGFTW